MPRALLLERSLAVVDPDVAAQLHPTRNGPVTAETVSAGSSARLWWVCPAGHDWQAGVKDRTRGAGCPSCAGRHPTPTTCLAARNPDLAAQWHPTRNDPLTPADVLPGIRDRVWWECPAGHEWTAPVSSRTAGARCPDCRRPRSAPTLRSGYPDLAAQWDTARNGDLTDTVTAGSNRRVGWRCAHGHRWTARVYSRTRGTGCPYCAGNRPTPETSLAALRPDLLTDWAGDFNGDLDPTAVATHSTRRVWWRCPTDPDHVWPARVSDRTRGAHGTGCPFCTGTRVTPQTSLAALHPQVAADWDRDRNGDRTPDTAAAGSTAYAWWTCPTGHAWQAQIASRTGGGAGCPVCAGRRATPATSLAVTHPALAAEWDPSRNGGLTPTEVRPYSNERVWWRCPAGHHWQAPIDQRSRRNSGCPTCAPRANHGHQLAHTRPDLAAQWADALNGGGPGTITTGSHHKAWWRCSTDPTHLWWAQIGNRVRGNTGCPYCAHKRPTPTTSLAAVAPQLAAQWHPDRNGTVSPTDVLPHSGVLVWWQCPEHHQWAATPAARLAGTGHGCPDCAARDRFSVHCPPAASLITQPAS